MSVVQNGYGQVRVVTIPLVSLNPGLSWFMCVGKQGQKTGELDGNP